MSEKKKICIFQEEPVVEQPRQVTKRLEEGIEKLKQFSFHSKD